MKTVFLFALLLVATACEPLAPESTQQIIVVTSPPTLSLAATATPVFGGAVPTTNSILTPTRRATATPTALPTATVPPCEVTEGTLFESSFASAIADGEIVYNIYLPPCFFESGRRFPYVILLHDTGDDFTQWADLGTKEALDRGAAQSPPLVVVMPDGGDFARNGDFAEGASFEDIILEELIPELERTYCLWTEAPGRGIGGISRGGFWAFSIALRYPHLFGRVGGHSPTFAPDNAPGTHNPLALAEGAGGIENLRIYLDNAQNDSNGANVIVFSNTLRSRGIAHTYVINAVGGHDNDYWRSHLSEYLDFYRQGLPASLSELPSCQ